MAWQFLTRLDKLFADGAEKVLTGVPDGYEALVLAKLLRDGGGKGPLVFVARDGQRMADVEAGLAFFAPWLRTLSLPSWDCLPYDRVSPGQDIAARRIAVLAEIAGGLDKDQPTIILTSPNALVQRVPPRQFMASQVMHAASGNRIDMDDLVRWLERNGFLRTSTVRETGEYAVRGGILDLFAPAAAAPLRLDFFGDTLESVRTFDPESQRTLAQATSLDLVPMSEVVLSQESIARFRRKYLGEFGAANRDDALYEAVSEGRRYAGMEHWLPLFFDGLETLYDYFDEMPIVFDHLAREALLERHEQIEDHYQARKRVLDDDETSLDDGGTEYKPVPVGQLYLTAEDISAAQTTRRIATISPFDTLETGKTRVIVLDGHQGRTFATERAASSANVFDALITHISDLRKSGKAPVIASWSGGARDRMVHVLEEHGFEGGRTIDGFGEIENLPKGATGFAVLKIENGFETENFAIISEQDVLGDRLVRKSRGRRKGSEFLSEVTALNEGDIVVHIDHGIARFTGLRTIEAAGAAHDCLELRYAGDDRLFLPVENIELLSRYGSADTEVQLDKLGGGNWQARKAKLKKNLLEMADALIKIAAARMLKTTEKLVPQDGLYDEFAARFPYEETDDQLGAIDAVLDDFAAGRAMDRLVCGDVGFGKTEVALRASFVAAMTGLQVAVVVPTTLLARQHYKTFTDRFHGLPINIAQASRLVGSKALSEAKLGISDGTVDIIIGTHALLGKSIKFRDLGLLIIDEEQRFGVKHKERLKELRSDVHVLTLSATPIPRTLQLALTGVRELSLITTAPVDRMAVRTFISPFDGLVVREALLRERYRGGQSFYVCPRVSDLAERLDWLEGHVPELKVGMAHGQMASTELEDVMNAFYDGKYDVLLSTTIVESGLDIPTANTLIVHRADMFGLAQLYQLRGRVGRSKIRAYALFTLPPNRILTPTAERRLKVLQSLDTLGAGFQLASHDLDIRGAGNLLGEEQSGQIREVGYELYQQMLEEAVAQLKEGDESLGEGKWSPQISVGTTVLIPENYVPDLTLRMGLYKRLADIDDPVAIDAFA
ncbi:MAG: transcription-repair coupling factor, partial [Hyphomicrobiales bacterium]|nr:transcription-repair coupling factor [Hyphomicrobiales bacterium]